MNEYEALFIINPDKESTLKEISADIIKAITKVNGKINKENNWGKQRLSYPIKKKTEGIYYKLDFSLDPSQISLLDNGYKLNPDILRTMITKK